MSNPKKEVSFHEKNSFVQREARPEQFNADLKTFKKVYPNHPLIAELDNKNTHNSQVLHERMLLTLLVAKTPNEITEARAKSVVKTEATKEADKPKSSPAVKAKQETTEADTVLTTEYVSNLKWNDLKKVLKQYNISTYRTKRPELEALLVAAAKKKTEQKASK